MAGEPYTAQPRSTRRGVAQGYLFGVPLGDLGWFTSLIMGLATGMAAFFAATFVGIMTILVLNVSGHRADYSWSYSRFGLPVGVVVMAVALGYLGTLWARRHLRRA